MNGDLNGEAAQSDIQQEPSSNDSSQVQLPGVRPSSLGETTTVKLPLPELPTLTPRWGALLDDNSRRLAFTLSGRSDPIVIACPGELIVGRSSREGPPPDFDLGQYATYVHGVSRHHAKIWYDGDMLKLVDLGSTNGTFLNGVRLPPRHPRILRDGDEVTFGRLSVQISLL